MLWQIQDGVRSCFRPQNKALKQFDAYLNLPNSPAVSCALAYCRVQLVTQAIWESCSLAKYDAAFEQFVNNEATTK